MSRKIKISKKELTIKIIVLIFIAAALVVSCFFSAPIEKALGIGKTDKSGNYIGVDVVTQNDFVVHYIDVKQADCTFIELPDGTNMLIDAGDVGTADEVVEYIQAVLGESLTIDHFVLTHSDSDHVGGAPKVFEAFEIINIYRPFALAGKYSPTTSTALDNFECNDSEDLSMVFDFMKLDSTWDDYISKIPRVKTDIYNQVIELMYAETYNDGQNQSNVTVSYDGLDLSDSYGRYDIEFYAPLIIEPYAGLRLKLTDISGTRTNGYLTKGYGATSAEGYNALCPVIRIEYLENSFIFTGDITTDAEADVVASLTSTDIEELRLTTVYQAGHHGATNSNSVEWLEIITPTYTVVSSNREGNNYGHPTDKFIERIEDLPHDITDYLLRTDQQGNIVFAVNTLGNVVYSANVELTYEIFEVEWWQIAVGIFIVSAVLLFNIKMPKKSRKS